MRNPYDARLQGMARTPVTRDLERPLLQYYRDVGVAAARDAGLDMSEIDGLFVSPATLSGEPWMMFAAGLDEYLGLTTERLGMYENGGCTALVALNAAVDAVESGACQAALVLAADTRPSWDFNFYEAFVHGAVNAQTGLHGLVNSLFGVGAPVPYYAMCHQRYLHEFEVTPEDVAEVAVLLRKHAAKNPIAQFRDEVTVEQVLASKLLSPPVHLLEAPSVSTGAVGIVVTAADGPGDDSRSVRIRGRGEHHTPSHFMPVTAPLTSFEATRRAAHRAFDEAGVKHSDIDICEVYGVFAATELITYEDLGFFDKGRAPAAVKDGKTTFGARTVFNPSGGRLSLGHPAGATPLYEVAEVMSQLRGESGDIQVDGACLGLLQAEHGVMNGVTVMILEGGAG